MLFACPEVEPASPVPEVEPPPNTAKRIPYIIIITTSAISINTLVSAAIWLSGFPFFVINSFKYTVGSVFIPLIEL